MGRVADEIAPWVDEDQISNDMLNMMADVALFEPDESGDRTVDRFLAEEGDSLTGEERTLADRMVQAQFSLFRVAEKHESAGVWVEDILNHDRRFWVVDKHWADQANPGEVIAMRLFEPGPFHTHLGVVVEPGDESLGPILAAWARPGPLPDQRSLAAQIYSDNLAVEAPADDDELAFVESFTKAMMAGTPERPERKIALPEKTPSKRSKRRKR